MATQFETESPEKIVLGKIAFTGKGIDPEETEFDRISIGTRGELFVLSIVSESQKVKAIRAILNGGPKALIQGSGVNVKRPATESGEYGYSKSIGNLHAVPEGYNVTVHKLGYAQVHALFVARTDGFMNVVTEDSLWTELNDTRFTTPIVREWVPYLMKKLKDLGLLNLCHSHRCECGILSAATTDLDKIVEEGVKTGELCIPEPELAGAN